MVDYNQLIDVNISRSSKYYKNKGYDVDKYKVRYVSPHTGIKESRYTIPSGTIMQIPLYDVQENSAYKIKVICDYCGKEIYVPYNIYNVRMNKSLTKKDACKKCIPAKKNESLIFDKFEDAKLMFEKKNCKLLGSQEIVKSKDILDFICNKHLGEIQHVSYHNVKRGQGMCKYCGIEQSGLVRRISFDTVKQAFENRGYSLISTEYTSCDAHLEYMCPKHPDVIQNITYYHLSKRGQGCSLCAMEARCGESHHNWKGGISPLHKYLRSYILQWKKDTLSHYNYECVLSGKQSFLVHHLYGFDKILKELIDYFNKNYNLNLIGTKVEDLSEEQLKMVSDKCLELHYSHGFGVVLDVNIHKLFHKYYKYGNNTPEQFKDFTRRYKLGEFDEQLKSM